MNFGSSSPIPIGTGVAPSSSMELLSECSPQQPFPTDFFSIPPSPHAYPQSPPPLRRLPSDYFASSMRQTASLPSTAVSGLDRWLKSQNGDQLMHLVEPIRDACNLYGTSNPHISTIFMLAQKGIERLEKHYIGRPLIIKTIHSIKTMFSSHVQLSLHTQPLPSVFTPHFAYPTATTSYSTLPAPSMPSATPPTLIPTPSPQIAKLLCWNPKELEDFAQDLVDMISNSNETPEVRAIHLNFRLQKINEKRALQRSLEMYGRSV